jgi:hypothetical protein
MAWCSVKTQGHLYIYSYQQTLFVNTLPRRYGFLIPILKTVTAVMNNYK